MDLFQRVFSLYHGMCRCSRLHWRDLCPLSRIITESSCFKILRASCISFVMLGLGGSAC